MPEDSTPLSAARLQVENDCELILNAAYNRRMAGAAKYGDLSFLERSAMQDAEEELLDMINYAMFAIIKLRRIKQAYPDL